MAELTQRVRDLTSAPRHIPIEVEGCVAFEVPLTIWAIFDAESSKTAFDLGPEWREEVTSAIPGDLTDEILELGGPHASTWLAIASLLLTAPHPHDPDNVYEWLRGVDDGRLRRWVLGYSAHQPDEALVEEASRGDMGALETLLGQKAVDHPEVLDHIVSLLGVDDLPERYAGALRRFRNEVFSRYEEDFGGAIARAAAARRAMVGHGEAKSVIEEVTSGIDLDIPLGITRVILIPSVICRPRSLIDMHRGRLLVYYAVADEFMDDDPEAPPSWVLRTYKALGDEKRLRILRRLSEGETSLDGLTDLLDLSKSTVHHHISILRGAGLIRVHLRSEDPQGKQRLYSLRRQTVEAARRSLDSYLRPDDEVQDHA